MNAENLGMTLSHSAALEVKRCVTIGIYPSWVSNAMNYGGRATRGQTRKNYCKRWEKLAHSHSRIFQVVPTADNIGHDRK